MPERPKRRKNNKNKRKNKNNKPELNKNNCDVKELDNSESCSNQGDKQNEVNSSAIQCDNLELVGEQLTNQNVSSTCNILNAPDSLINEDQNQDLNNNDNGVNVSNAQPLQTLEVPVIHSVNLPSENLELQESQSYVVESPEQSLKSKPKLGSSTKSKSLDSDDAPKIVEVTDDDKSQIDDDSTMSVIESSNVLVSDVDSDVEWENIDNLHNIQDTEFSEATGTLSVTSIPLNVAQCEQTKLLTPEEETSLRNYLKTLNLSTHPDNANSIEIKAEIEQIINREIRHRLRKKGLAEDLFVQRLGPPRTLDVIDEEGSSESSMTSRRQSYLSDKKSDIEDFEDDVFEPKKKPEEKYNTKSLNFVHNKSFGRLVPQQCVLVGAKIKEPEISEARGDWSVKTIEKITGAEVVYLTDSSSSTSSIHELGDTDDGVDTDVSVRMITPTIEVTDTEHFLKKSYISNNEEAKNNTHKQIDVTKPSKDEYIIPIKYEDNFVKKINENENPHEIVILSTDDIKTNLYVKDVEDSEKNINSMQQINDEIISTETKTKHQTESTNLSQQQCSDYNLEIKVLKCELNDAINNLIKEVVSDSENSVENSKEIFTRQDSSSSVSSSQCTAKYNPTYSSLNDVSNIMHDETPESNKSNTDNNNADSVNSHVKDVFECVTGPSTKNKYNTNIKQPSLLRDICLTRVASFPYGDKILEELASVSKRLQNFAVHGSSAHSISSKTEHAKENIPHLNSQISPTKKVTLNRDVSPPPVQPRKSSLKKTQDDNNRAGVPIKTEPTYICLSPSQKMLMEKTNTTFSKEDTSERNIHTQFIDHTDCKDYYKRDIKDVKSGMTPIVPFKSQTGSRLLALIRDPTVTGNVKQFASLDNLQRKYSNTETISQKNYDTVSNLSKTFKPIPPPRPKKLSSSFYESDESSDFTDSSFRSIKSERKVFHFSTGNLSKEIENDISSIQNMHRYYTNTRDELNDSKCPRRPSLPKDLCDQQMEYIRQKEKEVEAELQRIEANRNKTPLQRKGPRAPLISDKELIEESLTGQNNKMGLQNKERHEKGKLSSLFSSSQEEILRDKMYSEYVKQMAERQERKQHKVIKITNSPGTASYDTISKSMSALDILDSKVNNRIEKEFICKARERWNKLGIHDPDTEDERDLGKNIYREPKVIEHKIKVFEDGEEKDVKRLPTHLQDFVRFTTKDKEHAGSSGESASGPAFPHVVIWCAVMIIVFAVGKYFLRLLRYK